jgi:hypothetical protein
MRRKRIATPTIVDITVFIPHLYIIRPVTIAIGMIPKVGTTIWGVVSKVFAEEAEKTAITRTNDSQRNKEKTSLVVFPRTFSEVSATERPSLRMETIRLEKSCTPPRKIAPKIIQSTAGSHPQMAQAIAGPRMGPAPAIAAK